MDITRAGWHGVSGGGVKQAWGGIGEAILGRMHGDLFRGPPRGEGDPRRWGVVRSSSALKQKDGRVWSRFEPHWTTAVGRRICSQRNALLVIGAISRSAHR